MKKYKVTCYYRCEEVREVWASSDKEAMALAENSVEEEYGGHIESKVEVIEED